MTNHNLKRRYSLLVEFEAYSAQEADKIGRMLTRELDLIGRVSLIPSIEVSGPYDMGDGDVKPLHRHDG